MGQNDGILKSAPDPEKNLIPIYQLQCWGLEAHNLF